MSHFPGIFGRRLAAGGLAAIVGLAAVAGPSPTAFAVSGAAEAETAPPPAPAPPGEDGSGEDGDGQPGGVEPESPPSIVLRVDSDPQAEGDQNRVEEGRTVLFYVSAALDEEGSGLAEEAVVTVSVRGPGGAGRAGADDFAAVDDFTVTIPAGQTSGQAQFTLAAVDDTAVEGDETVDVTGTAAGGADVAGAAVTIADNDPQAPAPPPSDPSADLIVTGQADPAVAVNLSVDAQTASGEQNYVEEGESRTVTVKAALPDGESGLAEAATFPVTIAADTAENFDFTAPASASVTIAAGQTSGTATFTFQAASDAILEGPETVSLTSTLAGYSVSPASLVIKDEDAVFTVTANPTAVDEDGGGTSVRLTVAFPNAATSELTDATPISFRAAGEGAVAGTDFTAITDFTDSLAASAVTASTTVTVAPVDDVIDETSAEGVKFTGSLFGRTASATVAITDDDAAPTSIDLQADVAAAAGVQTVLAEDAGATSVTVSAQFASGTAVETDTVLSLRMSRPANTDFSLTIPRNQVRGTASVTVTPADNNMVGDAPQTVTVTLRGTSSYTVNQAQFTIEDDEEAVVNLLPTACSPSDFPVSEGDSRDACWQLDAMLPAGTVAVNTITVRQLNFTTGTAHFPDDFTVLWPRSQGELSYRDFVRIPAGQNRANPMAHFLLKPKDDGVRDEGAETIVISGQADRGFKVRTASIDLYDNDYSPNRIDLIFDASSALAGAQPSVPEGSSGNRVTVTAVYANRTARSTSTAVTVSVAGAGGAYGAEAADFTAVNDFTVTIPANQIKGSASFDLTVAEDDLYEGPEDLALSGTATGFTVNGTTLIIDDNETVPTVHITADAQPAAGAQSYVDEGQARTVTVTVAVPVGAAALTSQAVFPVAIAAGTAETGDFAAPATVNVTIPANARSGTATFSFTAAHDTVLEGPETVSLASSLAGYVVHPGTLTIRDQDSQFRLGISATAVAENASPTSLTLTVQFPNAATSELTGETQLAVTVTGDGATAGTDFAAIPDFVIPVAAGSLRGSKAVTFTPTDDAIHEAAAERAKFTVSWFGQAASALVSITDDDPAPTTINFSVDTSSDPGVQTSVAENGGEQTVTLTAQFASGAVDSDTVLRIDVTGTDPLRFGYALRGFPTTITIPKDQVKGTASFRIAPVNNDWVNVAERTVRFGILGASPYSFTWATLTIEDDEPAVINLAVRAVKCQPSDSAPSSADRMGEGDGKVCFEVSGALPSGVWAGANTTVSDLTFTGGGAVSGTDFTTAFPIAGRENITIASGNGGRVTPARVDITAVDDSTADEGLETIVISGRAAGYAVRPTAVILADNDDSANRINLTVDADSALSGWQPSLGEGVSGQTVTVTASFASGGARASDTVITMAVGAASGARQAEANDFTAVPGFTITIPQGQLQASGTFSLTTADDQRVEGAEDLAVTGTAAGFTVAGTRLTIDDDDAVSAIALSADADRSVGGTQTSIGEASPAVTAQVTAQIPDGKTFESDVVITVSVAGGGGTGEAEAADFAAVSDFTLTIPAGQSSASATFTLDPAEDDYAEGAETIAVTGRTDTGVGITGTSLQIADNDAAPTTAALTVDLDGQATGLQTTIGEGDAAATAAVAVKLPDGSKTFESETAVTVTFAGEGTTGKAEPSDFTTGLTDNQLSLTLPAGGREASGTFTLTIVDDLVADVVPETITVSGSADRSGLAVTGTSITIDSDNDSRPAVSTLALSVDADASTGAVETSLAEGDTRTMKVTASLPSGTVIPETDTEVTVTVDADGPATSEENDFTTPLPNRRLTMTIPGGSRSASATFSLTAVDDNVGGEGAETVFLSGSAAGFSSPTASFTITDGDRIDVAVQGNLVRSAAPRVLTAAEGSGPYATAEVRVRVHPPSESHQPQLTFEEDVVFTVRITADGTLATAEADDFSTDLAGDTLRITLPAGQILHSGTFTLTIADDAIYEGAEKIALAGSTALPGVTMVHGREAFITITDNETAPVISLTVDTDPVMLGDQDYISEGVLSRKTKVTASVPTGSAPRESDTVIAVSTATVSAHSPDDFSFLPWGDGGMELTLPKGAGQVSGFFSLAALGDYPVEGGETFRITGWADAFATNGRSDIVPATVTIDDANRPSVLYLRVDLDSAEDGEQKTAAEGTSVTATVSASLPVAASPLTSSRPVRVSLVGGGGDGRAEDSDFTAVTPFDITIASGDQAGTGSFRLQLADDAVADVLPELIEVSGSSSGWTVRSDFIGIDEDNDSFPEVDLSVRPMSVAESASEVEITVSAALVGSATLEEDIPVTVSVDGSIGTGMAGTDDFDAVADFPLTVGRTSRTGSAAFKLKGTDDNVAGEGTEKMLISGSVPYSGAVVNGVELLVTDGDTSPTVINLSVDADDETDGAQTSVTEGAAAVTARVTASFPDGAAVLTSKTTVRVSVAGGGGSGGAEAADFTAVPSFDLEIPAGAESGSATFSLTTVQDNFAEGAETLTVSGTASGFTVNSGSVTIADDDVASAFTLSVDADADSAGAQTGLGEGSAAKTARVTALLPADAKTFESDTVITVSVDGAGGAGEAEAADFAAVTDFTLTVEAGERNGTATFTFDPTEDDYAEGTEKVTVSGTAAGVSIVGAELEITDNDAAPTAAALSVDLDADTDGDQDAIGEGDAAVTATVTASLPSGSKTFESDTAITVTVSGEGTAGKAEPSDFSTDQTNNKFTVTISAGQTSGSATFTLTIADDSVADVVSETITLSGSADRAGLSVTAGAVTIDSDNDTGPTAISLGVDASSDSGVQTAVGEQAAAHPLTVSASFPNGSNVYETATVITLSAAGVTASAGDFTLASATPGVSTLKLSIPAGQTSVSASSDFQLTAVDDNIVERAETLTIGGAAAGFVVSGVTMTINDNDVAPTAINLTVDADSETVGEQTGVSEGDAATTVTVKAALAGSTVLTSDTVVKVSVAGEGTTGKASSTDFTAVAAFNITIPAGDASSTGTFTLTVADDNLAEGSESLTVSGTTAAAGFTAVNGASLDIADNDVAPAGIILTLNPTSVGEDDGATSVGVTASFPAGSAALTSATSVTVSVAGSSATAGTDFAAVSSFTVSIAAGSVSGSGSFTFTPTNDTVAGEGTETVAVTGAAAGFSFTNAVLSIADQDAQPSNILLTVDTDSGTSGDQSEVAENAGAVTVSVTASFPAGSPTMASPVAVTVKLVGEAVQEGAVDLRTVVYGMARGKTLHTENYDYSTDKTNDAFTITIPAGSLSQSGTFTLTVEDDSLQEGSENFSVTGSATGFMFNASPKVTITDNEMTNINLFFSNSVGQAAPFAYADTLQEGLDVRLFNHAGTPISFTMHVTLGTVLGDVLHLDVETSGTAKRESSFVCSPNLDYDYSIGWHQKTPDGRFTIDRNQSSFDLGGKPAPTHALIICDDNIAEGDETIVFTGRSSLGNSNTISMTIRDNDVAPTVINLAVDTDVSTAAVSETSLMEGDAATTVKVTASFPANSAVLPTPTTVAVSVANNTATANDHLAVNSFNVVIPALASSGSATFAFTPVDDAIVEGPETLDIEGTASGFTVNSAMMTIKDNETISLSVDTDGIEDGDQTEVDEGASAQTVTVTAAFDADSTVLTGSTAVTASVASGGTAPASAADFTAVDDFTITIPAGSLSASATFDLTVAADNIAGEGSETLSVSGSATGYTISDAALSIADLTAAPNRLIFTVDADSGTVGNQTSIGEGISNRTVRASAAFPNGSTVWAADLTVPATVGAGTAENTDYSVTGGTFNLTIPAGGTSSNVKTFTLTTVDDDVAGETDALSIGTGMAGYTVTPASLVISDADSKPTQITLSAATTHLTANDSVEEGTSDTVTATATFAGSIVLETALSVPAVVAKGTSEGAADYTATPSSFNISIPANSSSGSADFTLAAVDDNVAGETDAVAVNGGTLAGYTITGTAVKLIDKDAAPTQIALKLDADTETTGVQSAVAEGVSGRTVRVWAEWVNTSLQLESNLTIPVTVAAGTAESGDFSVTGGTFNVVLPGASQTPSAHTFTLTVNDDNVAGETDVLSVGGTLAGYTITPASLTLGDSDSKPTSIALSIATDHQTADDSVDEGTSGTVTVTASFPSDGTVLETALTVPVVVADGTTDGSADYTVSSASFNVSIPANSRSGTANFTLNAKDDDVAEGTEEVAVNGGTLAGYSITSDKVKILDGDSAPTAITLTVDADPDVNGDQTSVGEGTSNRTVSVWASFPSDGAVLETDVTVPVVVAAGTAEATDYTVGSASFNVTIGAGARQSAVAGTFSLTVNNDDVSGESDVLSVKGGTLAGFTITPAPLTLSDADTAPSVITLTIDADANTVGNQTSVDEGVTGRSVRVWASFPAGSIPREAAVKVPVTVAAGTAETGDFSVDDSSLEVTIGAGTLTSATPDSFSLQVPHDDVAGESDALSVEGGTLAGFTISAAPLSLGDADALPSQVTLSVSPTTVAEDGTARTVSVWAELPSAGPVLESSLAVPVVVAAGTAEAGDYSVDDGTFNVTIGAGRHKSATAGTFSLTVNSDDVAGESDKIKVGGGTLAGYTITAAEVSLGDADVLPSSITLSLDADPGSNGLQTSVGEGISSRSVSVWAELPSTGPVLEGSLVVPVVVSAGTAEASDYSIADNTFDVTIGTGTRKSATAGTFSLTVNNDDVAGESDKLSVGGGTLAGYSFTAADLTLGDSDTAPTSITLSASPVSAAEGTANRLVSVTAAWQGSIVRESAATVPVTVAAGTAEASDYSIADNTFDVTIAGGSASGSGSFSLTVNDDDVAGESDRLSITGSKAGFAIASTGVTLGDSDAKPNSITLSVDADPGTNGAQTSVGEGTSNRSVSVWAEFPSDGPVLEGSLVVPVAVAAGTAEASDFSIVDNTFEVTIGAGTRKSAAAGTFSLTVNNDDVSGEKDVLSVGGGTLAGYTIIAADLTLSDADAAPADITLTIDADPGTNGAQSSVGEGTANRSVSVWAEFPSDGPVLEGSLVVPVVVSAGTAEGSDYSIVDNTFDVTIGAGTRKSAAAGTFSLTVNDDNVAGESDKLSVGGGTLAGYSFTAAGLTLGDSDAKPSQITLTMDADSGTEGEQSSVGEGVSGRSVSVWAEFPSDGPVLEGSLSVPVVVSAGTAEASDYSIVDNTFDVTIGAGTHKSATAGTFSLTVNDDNVAGESDRLSVGGGTLAGYSFTAADLTLGDSDTAPTSIALSASPGSAAEGTANRSVSVTAAWSGSIVRESAVTVPVTVSAGTAETSDYSIADNTFDVTIAGGSASGSASFSLTVNDDDVAGESDRLSVTGSKAGFTIASTGVTLGDSDAKPTSITMSVDADPDTEGNQTSIGEGVTGRSVSVWAEFPASGPALESDVTVNVTVAAGTAQAADFTASGTTGLAVTIGAGTSKSASAAFTLNTVDDSISGESNEAITVSGSVSGDSSYSFTAASLSITDGDSPPSQIILTVDTDPDATGSQTQIAEGVSNRTVTVTAAFPAGSPTLLTALQVPVVVEADTAEASDFTVSGGSFNITIPAGQSSAAGTFTLTASHDDLSAETDAIAVKGGTLAGYTITPASISITDADAAPTSITLTVDVDGSADGLQTEIFEGGGAHTVSVWAAFPDGSTPRESAATVAVEVVGKTAEATDFSVTGGSFNVTIGGGTLQSAAPGTFTIEAVDDTVAAETDVVLVDGTLAGFTVTDAEITIKETDTAVLSLFRDIAPTAIKLTVDTDSDSAGAQTGVGEGVSARSVSVWAEFADGSAGSVFENDVTVAVTVAAGTAEATDFSIVDSTFDVVIGAGTRKSATPAAFSLTVADDDVAGESDVLSVDGTKSGFTVAGAKVTLGDADVKPSSVALTVSPTSAAEDGTARTVSVWAELPSSGPVLETALTAPVLVSQGTAETSDYTVDDADFDVTIGAGRRKSASAGSFTLTVRHDDVGGEDDKLQIKGGTLAGFTIAPAALTLGDADAAPTEVVLSANPSRLEEGAANRSVTVTAAWKGTITRESPLTIPVSATAGTAEASDYSIAAPSFDVTIGGGAASGSASFAVTVHHDQVSAESDKLQITGAKAGFTVAAAGLTLGDADTAPTAIALSLDADPDAAGRQSAAPEGTSGRAVKVWAAFPSDSAPREQSVTVNLAVGDGSTGGAADYSVTGTSGLRVTIGAGTKESASPALFTFTAKDDDVSNETGEAITVSGAVAGDSSPPVFSVASASLGITDGDTPPNRIILTVDADGSADGDQNAVGEGVSDRTVTVTAAFPAGSPTLPAHLDVPVSVAAGTAEPADYTVDDADFTIRIAAGDSSNTGTFTLTVADDNVAGERDALEIKGGQLAGYTIDKASLSLTDADAAPTEIILSLDDTEVTEGQTEKITITAAFPAASAVLETDVPVTATVAAAGSTAPADFSADPDSFNITIPAGSPSSRGSFNLTARDDDIAGEHDKVEISGAATDFSFNDPVTVNIADADPDPSRILLSVDKEMVDEGSAAQQVTVTASFDGSKWDDNTMVRISVGADTAEPGDYTADNSSFTVVINRETQSVSGTFQLTANSDADYDDERIAITGREMGEKFAVAQTAVTIRDDDSAPAPPTGPIGVDPVVNPPAPPPPPSPPDPPGPAPLPPAPAREVSSDASLRSLRVSPGTLSPAFSPATLGYTAAVSANVWTLQVAAVPNHAAARATIDGSAVSGAHPVFIGSDRRSVEVVVTAEDGVTTQTYRLAITRGSGPGFADSLSSMTACTGAALRPFGFEDVAGWFSENDINCIGYYGITLGRTATRFAPTEVVSRWQMALFLFRAAGPAGVKLPEAEEQGFSDIGGLSAEAKRAANMMAQLGVMPGADGKFDPQGKISRAAMALMLDSFLGLATVGEGGVDRDDVQPDEVLFDDIGGLSEANQLAIRRIFEMGVTRGTSTTEFRPGNPVTRGQMAQFIARTLAHTIARPVGVSIQTDPSSRAGSQVDVVVSVRDEDFRPAAGERVDLLTARDRNAAFTDDGTCVAAQVSKVGGAQVCAIDSSDRATGPTGDLRVTTARAVGTTIWAWRAEPGARLDDSRPTAHLTFR